MKLQEELFDFAYIPSAHIEALVNLAAAEGWGESNWVLKSYIKNLYKRIAQVCNASEGISAVDIISVADNRACFDTGLYTGTFERIFALFTPNRVRDKQPWCLQGFYRENDVALHSAGPLPHRVVFYDDPADLVFDVRLEINVNYDHILGDEENVSRFPASLQGGDKVNARYRALEGALAEAKKRVAANYMLAVPQFFTDKNSAAGKVQLLLPLCLTGDKPELALTLERSDGSYVARTCLTLPMAYNNARLINKPEAQWLVQGGVGVDA